ncbi:hypothetical protein KC325_g40 [Hortaea werneckii]|nr:hypothetical protein KC325_g40 [Hortaea werneckii]
MDPVALVEEVLDAASLDPVSVETTKLKVLEPLPVDELGLERHSFQYHLSLTVEYWTMRSYFQLHLLKAKRLLTK